MGVVGAGVIGGGITRCLANAGYEVEVFDVDRARADELKAVAGVARSSKDLASAVDLVIVTVFDDSQVRSALGDETGVFAATDRPEAVCIVSTVSTQTIRWVGDAGRRLGIKVLDCGVAGPRGLLTGEGSTLAMVGGDEDAYAYARPVLEVFADPLLHMGPLGAGMQAKLGRNMLHYEFALLAFEAGRLIRAGDVDGAKFVTAVGAREDAGPSFTDFLRKATGASEEGSEISLEGMATYAVKDLAAVLELGAELDVDLPAASRAARAFASMLED